MASALDFSKFTFTAEQIRDVNEMIFDDIMVAPEITLITTMYPGIVFDKEIGFIGEGGLVGKASQGCDPKPQVWKIGTRTVKWTPKSWEILIRECFTDLESTAAVYALKTGVDISDFSDTDYYAIITEVLSKSVLKFIIRLFWFSDEKAKNVSDGGSISNGVDVGYFNIIDGFFKQMQIQLTANPKQRVAIAENAGASYESQELDPNNINKYLRALKFKSPMRLRSKSNNFIVCTQSVYDAWEQYLQGKDLESTYANLVDGQRTLAFNGIPLVPMPIWDEIITSCYDNGTRYENPHIAIFVNKDILAVGVDSANSFDEMSVWHEKKERYVYTELMGKADAKLLDPTMFQLAI